MAQQKHPHSQMSGLYNNVPPTMRRVRKKQWVEFVALLAKLSASDVKKIATLSTVLVKKIH